jgi:hypothetical protein
MAIINRYADSGQPCFTPLDRLKLSETLLLFTISHFGLLYSRGQKLIMKQILISTKFAASVSLDIFVRCYYGMLMYNYKHFMCQRQLHEVDAKSSYLQC